MKKILSLLLIVAMTMGLAACGKTDSPAKTDPTPEAGGNDTPTEVTKVALLLPYIGDQSYFDVTNNGLTLLEEKYGDAIECTLIEMGMDEAGWETANRQAAEAGYDIIISGNWQYEASMLTVAKEYPEIKYLNFDFSDVDANKLDNVYGIGYASNETGYLCGVVAAVKSKSGVIGGVGGMDNNGIRQFMAGYMQGAYDVNPDIKVIVSYVGSFADANTAKEQALNMITEGADVIWHAAGGSGNGVFAAVAEKEGVWALGVDTDQYVSMSGQPDLAKTILTSGLKKCDYGILNAVSDMIDGKAAYGTQKILTFADNGVGLAENDFYKQNMTEEELAKVKEFSDKVASGATKVVDELTEPGVYDEYLAKVGK